MPVHQAAGLARLFQTAPAEPVSVISVLASAHGAPSSALALALADSLSGESVCLVQTGSSRLSALLGCQVLHTWQPDMALDAQIVPVRGFHLLCAPDCPAGDVGVVDLLTRSKRFQHIVFDAGVFDRETACLDPQTVQMLLLSVGEQDHEAAYALLKGLHTSASEVDVLLLGAGAPGLSQLHKGLLDGAGGNCKISVNMCPISNTCIDTSSNALTIPSNLSWIVSRIRSRNHKRVANGGIGKSTQ